MATGAPRGELGRDNSTQWITSPNTHAHYKPIDSNDAHDIDSRTSSCERLGEGSRDDDDELYAIYNLLGIVRPFQDMWADLRSHMRFRPTRSASHPNNNCPRRFPTGYAISIPKS
jgi:hypothetical protein